MRWVQSGMTYGNAKWHLSGLQTANRWGYESYLTACGQSMQVKRAKVLPEDRRPALARNNVCAHCKKLYLKTRPDLQGFVDRLNDKKDV